MVILAGDPGGVHVHEGVSQAPGVGSLCRVRRPLYTSDYFSWPTPEVYSFVHRSRRVL